MTVTVLAADGRQIALSPCTKRLAARSQLRTTTDRTAFTPSRTRNAS